MFGAPCCWWEATKHLQATAVMMDVFQRHETIVHGFIWLHELHAEAIFMTCFSFEGRYIGEIIMILMAILLSVPVVLMLVSNCRQFWALD